MVITVLEPSDEGHTLGKVPDLQDIFSDVQNDQGRLLPCSLVYLFAVFEDVSCSGLSAAVVEFPIG